MNKKLKSSAVTEGVEKAPMRSLFYAMGYTKAQTLGQGDGTCQDLS